MLPHLFLFPWQTDGMKPILILKMLIADLLDSPFWASAPQGADALLPPPHMDDLCVCPSGGRGGRTNRRTVGWTNKHTNHPYVVGAIGHQPLEGPMPKPLEIGQNLDVFKQKEDQLSVVSPYKQNNCIFKSLKKSSLTWNRDKIHCLYDFESKEKIKQKISCISNNKAYFS